MPLLLRVEVLLVVLQISVADPLVAFLQDEVRRAWDLLAVVHRVVVLQEGALLVVVLQAEVLQVWVHLDAGLLVVHLGGGHLDEDHLDADHLDAGLLEVHLGGGHLVVDRLHEGHWVQLVPQDVVRHVGPHAACPQLQEVHEHHQEDHLWVLLVVKLHPKSLAS